MSEQLKYCFDALEHCLLSPCAGNLSESGHLIVVNRVCAICKCLVSNTSFSAISLFDIELSIDSITSLQLSHALEADHPSLLMNTDVKTGFENGKFAGLVFLMECAIT